MGPHARRGIIDDERQRRRYEATGPRHDKVTERGDPDELDQHVDALLGEVTRQEHLAEGSGGTRSLTCGFAIQP